jgi:beta-lactam-binding protein with PASTA domain
MAMDMTLSRPPAGHLLDSRYRVDSWLARGGMATVYLGTDTRLDRTVALKIAHPEVASDPEFAQRFIAEARSVARLSSPNVVAVYDQGSDGGLLYLAMEYVPGRTLRELLRASGRLSPGRALDIIEGVLSGLAAAHEAGIVHRDVKPENVLINSAGAVKVADFGLARAMGGGDLTRTGMIIGTAAYLAPEQVARSASDARTDVYAVGVMLFEMLTGRQPHTGGSPLEVAHKHVNEPVPAPSSLEPGLPAALDELVALATSRDPARRPDDAGRFLSSVIEVRRGLPAPAPGKDRQPGTPDAHPDYPELGPVPGYPGRHREVGRPVQGPLPWPGAAPQRPALLPAGGVPGKESSGLAAIGLAPAAQAGQADQMNHTLVVPALGGDGFPPDGYPPHGRRDRRDREPRLQRWLFSRRLAYIALALAVVVVIAAIAWWMSSGRYETVPRLRGVAVSTARAELDNLGFRVRVGRGRNSDLPKGEVLSTSPAASARAARGSTVTIVESLGPKMIRVPQVTGVSLQDAVTALKKAGLRPGRVITEASPTIAAGIVVSTSPVAGTAWPADKPVAITVSAGPPLPDFVGQQLQQAQATAQQGGYQLDPVTVRGNQPQGTIVSQSPAPGTPITAHEVVTVKVSAGPPLVTIPNVTGMTVRHATAVLQQAGFQVQVSPGFGRRVSSYSPTGQAPRGSTITLNVSFFPAFGGGDGGNAQATARPIG